MTGGVSPWGGTGGAPLEPPSSCPDVGASCGATIVSVQDLHLDLYFVVDRSSSMAEAFLLDTSRFATAVEAVLEAWSRHAGVVRIGVTVLPDPRTKADCASGFEVWPLSKCEGTAPELVADGLAEALDIEPNGRTPVATTFDLLREHPPQLAENALVILLTDGKANCVAEACLDSCTVVSIAAFRQHTGVDVLVVAADPAPDGVESLNDYAIAGGRPAEAADKFIRLVDDATPLSNYLEGVVASHGDPCVVPHRGEAVEPEWLDVYLDCAPLPMSATDGWTWSEEVGVVLHGSACERVRGLHVKTVSILQGCEPPAPPR